MDLAFAIEEDCVGKDINLYETMVVAGTMKKGLGDLEECARAGTQVGLGPPVKVIYLGVKRVFVTSLGFR